MSIPNISVCIISKDEEEYIARCLEAIVPYGFEIIVVDTGSTDNTFSIAKKYTPNTFTFKWINDFSAARNYSISKASNDWILVLDCDEIITALDIKQLEKLTKLPEQCIGTIKLRNHFDNNGIDSIYIDSISRFFNKKAINYSGSIHEQLHALRPYPIPPEGITHATGIECEHFGYSGSSEKLQKKFERNTALLLKELEENPNDPYLYFQLGQSYNNINDEKALEYYSKGLEFDLDPSQNYVQMMVTAYGYCLIHLERYNEALELLSVYDDFSTTADFICMIGIAYMRSGQYLKAMTEFLKASMHPVSRTEGSNSFIPLYNMGLINEMAGDTNSALEYYKKCGSFLPAQDRIANITAK